MKKYNHAFDLGFEVISENSTGATTKEILDGIMKRVEYLKNNPDELQEACGLFDTFEIED